MTTQMEKFKNAITEPTKTIEQKGIDAYEVDNHTSYMLTTNNRNLFKLSSDDRRFFFVSMDNFGGTTEEKGDYFDDFNFRLLQTQGLVDFRGNFISILLIGSEKIDFDLWAGF